MQSYYEQALERCKQEAIQDETYYNGLAVTTSYNMGRLHEALSQFEAAENFYKIILKVLILYCICYAQSSYLDCLRISLREAWIRALCNNSRIAHTILSYTTVVCKVRIYITHRR